MRTARLLTIGTEIVSGEIINSNAAWISQRLENLGLRVLSHFSVRDQREEILEGLAQAKADFVFVSGGLGPTSDDITRDCVAEFAGVPLEFDKEIWAQLEKLYSQRGLPLREAHRQQCHFPKGSERLPNPVGTALGFSLRMPDRHIFVTPGPPRELEGVWREGVEERLARLVPPESRQWIRWTCLGAPESEVAEVVEAAVQGSGLEVGYRAQVPYVKVKVYADPEKDREVIARMEAAMKDWIVARGTEDLAEKAAAHATGWRISDTVCGARLFARLEAAGAKDISFTTQDDANADLRVRREGECAVVTVKGREYRKTLDYRVSLDSERGQRSMVEWILWFASREI